MANSRLCSIPDCGKPHLAQGLCSAHYRRFMRHGDPLVRKNANIGEPMKFIEDVVLSYEGGDCLIWPFGRMNGGYGSVRVNNNTIGAHRYICTIANGEPPTADYEAAHSCGKGHEGCVNANHLEWKTRSSNQMDRVEHGTSPRGENQWNSKLTEAQVLEIRTLKGSRTLKKIADEYGVGHACIKDIMQGRSWHWLE